MSSCSVAEHARFSFGVDSYHLMSNWGVWENHGLFLASLALPKSETTDMYTKEALRRLALEIQIQVYDDGVQWSSLPCTQRGDARLFGCGADGQAALSSDDEVIREKTH
jgi:hypothetical protein